MPIRPRAFGLRPGVFGDRLPSQHRVPQAERFTVGFRGAGFLETELPTDWRSRLWAAGPAAARRASFWLGFALRSLGYSVLISDEFSKKRIALFFVE